MHGVDMQAFLNRVATLFVALTLGATALAPIAAAQASPEPAALKSSTVSSDLMKARLEGEVSATNAGGWFGRSVVIGALTGLIGTTITYAVAASSTPTLPTEQKLLIADKSPEYRVMFEKGYADKVRGKRKSTALGGGLLGTAALVALVVSSGS